MIRNIGICLMPFVAVFLSACGSSGNGPGNNGGNNGGGPTLSAQHVVVVVLENENYSDVVGSPSMPFWNSLAQQNSLATQFFANAHPSLPDYMEMTTGNTVELSDSYVGPYTGQTISQVLTAAGKTWKAYAESIPSVGYTGGDSGLYLKHHNPFALFQDVLSNPSQVANIVPFTQFASDLSANALPSFSFVVPNAVNDGHDCPGGDPTTCPVADRLTTIDNWLKNNVGPLVSNQNFMSNGLLVIIFDESASDNTMGGGRIPVILAGGQIKSGFQSLTTYQFQSLLRFSLNSLGVTTYPGDAASAPNMNEFVK